MVDLALCKVRVLGNEKEFVVQSSQGISEVCMSSEGSVYQIAGYLVESHIPPEVMIQFLKLIVEYSDSVYREVFRGKGYDNLIHRKEYGFLKARHSRR